MRPRARDCVRGNYLRFERACLPVRVSHVRVRVILRATAALVSLRGINGDRETKET